VNHDFYVMLPFTAELPFGYKAKRDGKTTFSETSTKKFLPLSEYEARASLEAREKLSSNQKQMVAAGR